MALILALVLVAIIFSQWDITFEFGDRTLVYSSVTLTSILQKASSWAQNFKFWTRSPHTPIQSINCPPKLRS
ncbi:MAG: hypothetical protein KME32_30900 [Mojavia pulchra JT2-VF2]|uniref:Uncharacterized protein n=1 Tax=Mojavia pulchra JT2-VF2 TaxID=287848 RepID=A0A951Q4Z3_9NOST|nr:hypothetical protein [Mojavia pulchra JT2-VF2]